MTDWDKYESQMDSYEEPETLVLEEGEAVTLTVSGTDSMESDYNDDLVPVVEGQTKEGKFVRIIGFGTVLKRELEKANPYPGDVLGIKFVSVASKSKPGQQPAKIYRVIVFERGKMGQAADEGKLAALANPQADDIEAAAVAQAKSAKAIAQEAAAAAEAAAQKAGVAAGDDEPSF